MSAAPLKMADLVEQTGVSRETIRFYINQGLLPKPEKTAHNQAVYTPRHVELIQIIRDLQQERFLPLKAIKALLHEDEEFDFTPEQQALIERVRRNMVFPKRRAHRHLSSLCDELRLDEQDQAEILASGLLVGKADDLNTEDVELVRIWAELRASGLSRGRGFGIADMEIFQTAANVLFEQELQVFVQRMGDMSETETERLMTKVLPSLERVFCILHRRRIEEFFNHFETARAEGDAQ